MEQTTFNSKEFNSLAKKRSPKGKLVKKEEKIQIAISKYLKIQYPDVIFNSDIASGMRLTIGQASRAKAMRSGRGQPDLIILEPRGKYSGLCIELKKHASDVCRLDGSLRLEGKSNLHIKEQNDMLTRLREKGYYAEFGLGFDHTKKMIDDYMEL